MVDSFNSPKTDSIPYGITKIWISYTRIKLQFRIRILDLGYFSLFRALQFSGLEMYSATSIDTFHFAWSKVLELVQFNRHGSWSMHNFC